MADLNVAVTLPGEGALGTFEAGAISALIVAAQASEALDIDILTGASSGALTSVIAAAALLTGSDPVGPLRRAWVTEPSLDSLRDAQLRAPLSLRRARSVGHSVLAAMLLDGGRPGDGGGRRMSQVTVECALTCLRGYTYTIPAGNTLPARNDVMGTRHLDWARSAFTADDLGGVTEQWSTALDSAIASASVPLAFPPSLLERPPAEHDDEINNLPAGVDDARLWYADGGLVNREPLRRCVRLARESKANGRRRVLAVRPSPEDAPGPGDLAWTGAAEPPRYRETLERSLRVLVTHNLYEDLRAVEATNARIARTQELARTLATLIPDLAAAGQTLGAAITTQADLADLLEQHLRVATGLAGRASVHVNVVAPRHASDVGRGAAGFTAERIRATDFLLGYQAMLEWMKGQVDPEKPVEAQRMKAAIDAVRGRAGSIPGWLPDVPTGRRPLRVSAKLARLGARTIRAGLTNPRAGDPN